MNHELFRDYFYKGFEDGLEKESARKYHGHNNIGNEDKKPKSFNEIFKDDFNKNMSESITKGISNAIVRGSFHVAGIGAKGLIRAAIGDKLTGEYKEFISKLLETDSILKGRNPDTVVSHYKTMVRVAPSIALDPNVVSSFLRESTTYETMNTVTIKTLLDLEKTMTENRTNDLRRYSYLLGGK